MSYERCMAEAERCLANAQNETLPDIERKLATLDSMLHLLRRQEAMLRRSGKGRTTETETEDYSDLPVSEEIDSQPRPLKDESLR